MLWKSIFRTIRKSIGRYLAILAIIALGVGFFAGLRVTEKAMLKTADGYIEELNLFDFRLISTLGFTEEDLEAFQKLAGIEAVCGSVSADFIFPDESGSEAVLHAHMLTDGMNGLDMVEGRLPEKPDECVLDVKAAGKDAVGSKIRLSEDNSEEVFDTFAFKEYTVVGTVNASAYMNFERGTTTLANGSVVGYLYLMPEGFLADYYTEIYLTIPRAGEIYSSEYEDAVNGMEDSVKNLLEERAEIRYDNVYSEAEEEIRDAQAELEEKKQEAADAQKEIDEGMEKYLDGRKEAEEELAEGKRKLDDARTELNQGKAELDKARTELDNGKAELDKARAELDNGKAELESGRLALEKAKTELERGKAELAEKRGALEAAMGNVSQTGGGAAENLMAQLKAAEEELLRSERLYEENARRYQESVKLYEEKEQLYIENLQAYEESERLYTENLRAYEENERLYTENLEDYEASAADVRAELEKTEKELKDAQAELDEAMPELEDAQKEIADALEELAELKRPTTYVLDRSSNIGYASLENDTKIVSGVAKVFPVFFFLVAALVCITTMTRMVNDQRTENGVLKALGYGNGAIAGQYLFYAGSASALGCVAGFLIGSRFLPMVLWKIYHIMYSIDRPVAYVLDLGLFAFCTVLYLLCALGATWFVCYHDLKESSAQLIRPKAPAAGKRVFLEKIGFVWKRISFLHKVSIRNILRYKKRLVMMILGIGGCTALLLTGFGIRDTIQPVVGFQYNEITLYDGEVSFREEADEEKQAAFLEAAEKVTSGVCFLYSENVDIYANKKKDNINLVVYEEAPDAFVNLHDGKEPVAWPKAGEAVIDYRFAKENGLAIGDELELQDDERILRVTISGIFDNYIYDYIYICADTCREQWGSAPECNTAYVNFKEGEEGRKAGAILLGLDNVASINISDDMVERVGNMLSSLDYVVLIVLVCAGALAFIVLYNLTNIMITERTREIATLKVLGFYLNEQNAYVFRENLVLTGISALCGLPMGMALLYYVMGQIRVGSLYFGYRIAPQSYVFAILLTFVFTLIVDLALTAKTGRIHMAEAMKAVE